MHFFQIKSKTKENNTDSRKKVSPLTAVLKAGATMLLLFLMWYLCSHFMEYQKNATNQVNKYRIDQVCLMSDRNVITQKFQAKHTHLKTVKLYFSNDYGSEAKGRLDLVIADAETGENIVRVSKKINELANNEYTDFDTNIQLAQYKEYMIRIHTVGAQSGKEPIVYQWSTKEKGFSGKLMLNGIEQNKYLVAKFYYPVTIYYQWMGIICCIGLMILLVLFPIPLKEPVKATIGYLLFACAPLFTFWIVERFTDNLAYKLRPGEALFNIVLYYMFFGLLWAVTGSKKVSVFLGMASWYAIALANYYVLSFKGSPIVPADFRSAGTAASVAENYTYTIQPVFVWNALFMMLFFFVFVRCDKKQPFPLKWRFVTVLTIALIGVVIGGLVMDQATLKSVGIKNNVWDQKKGYAKNGLFFGFVLNMNALVQEKPAKYSRRAAEAISSKYEEQFANNTLKNKGRLYPGKNKKANIICIMNEAFSDLSVVGDFKTSQDYMPYIRSLKKNTIKGNLYMSIFGSGTCNSEFEFLSGDTMAFLNSGIIAYTQVIKDKLPNVTWNLRAQGYAGNLALHPYLASGWNRIDIYEKEGFEHFYSQDDFTNPLMYRKYISDASDFEKIEELYENRESKDDPFYLFNVTMQNHGGFNKTYDNFTNDVLITDLHKNEQAEQYLSLIKKTDEAFEQLTRYFSKVKEPTIIVMFGDHQPSLESSFYDGLLKENGGKRTQEELLKKYEVPFIIWANYDIKETTIDKMSANYLGAYVMRQAGLAITPYQRFLLRLYRHLPVLCAMGAIDQEGNYYESAQDSPYKDLVNEYQILQYNSLIDTKHTVHSFFYLEE